MRLTCLYVAGPMAGYQDHNFPNAFGEAVERLRAAGFAVISPADFGKDGGEWADFLRRDLRALLSADGVATLPGWELSHGTNLEIHVVAHALGMLTMSVDNWISRC